MTLDQLRIFVAVAERLHVTRAAEAINISQSAASAAIASLEARYAVQLFDRIGRRIVLTPAGEALLERARTVLLEARAAEAALDDLAGLRRGTLSLFASQTIANYWLPPLLSEFHRTYPGIQLKVAIGNTDQAASAVRAGVATVGFAEGQIDGKDLVPRTVAGDRLVLVASPNHPWTADRRIRARDLATIDWVLREKGSGTRAIFEAALAAEGVDPAALRVALELPSNEAVVTAVMSGTGVAALSELVVEPILHSGRLVELDFQLPERCFLVFTHRERRLGRAEQALLDMTEARYGACSIVDY